MGICRDRDGNNRSRDLGLLARSVQRVLSWTVQPEIDFSITPSLLFAVLSASPLIAGSQKSLLYRNLIG